MEVNKNLYVFCLVVAFVGGVNWLVTGIRSMAEDNDEVKDLLNYVVTDKHQVISNIIYFVVFLCTAVLLLPLLPKM